MLTSEGRFGQVMQPWEVFDLAHVSNRQQQVGIQYEIAASVTAAGRGTLL
ncbi:hypothetical protein CLV79_106132 [Limimaricola soesokkakensis]|uniref:Uncharacterized protein n=1 Tax=Limimaricola soesokkakensis TaxID=1343159 RepID=A0A1X6ZF95_9RHOB|nr:hypothetical protein CLV79_106132 [Limimaricola soesokkakensis]SLN50087.1 hypothetical protein LOS8367_02248 [Limimaricola soesokkakensis]